jgi:competence protein ComEC
MPKKLLTKIIVSLLLLVSLFINVVGDWPDKQLHLIFCDVGQGDAILITDGFNQMLVDGGRNDSVLECLWEHMPFWDRTIELVVTTHADADHISGLTHVFQNFQVLEVLMTSQTKQTDDFDQFKRSLDKLVQGNTKVISPRTGLQITLTPRVISKVIWPETASPETILSDKNVDIFDKKMVKYDYNNGCIVLFIKLDGVKVLLTGDLEKKGETAVLDGGLIQDVDILKVGHHGSKTSSTPGFLAVLQPEESVISVGKSNGYGHPSPEIIDRLSAVGSRILRTDERGSIEFLILNGQYQLR